MCFGASVLLRKASALKRIDVRYGPQNAHNQRKLFLDAFHSHSYFNSYQPV